MKLIRWPFWIFHRLKHQDRFVQGLPQVEGASTGASEVGYHFGLANAAAAGPYACTRNNQANIYQTYDMAEGRGEFKGYDRALSGLKRNDGLAYANARSGLNIGHDRFPLGLKARFGRSCRAFVNAWRVS